MANRLAVMILFLVFISPVREAPIQPKGSPLPQKTLRILIEGEDRVMVELLSRELEEMSAKIGVSLSFMEKEGKPYDLRLLLTSGVGSKSDSCTPSCSTTDGSVTTTSTSCSITITIYFASVVVLTPEGKFQSTDTGVGISRLEAKRLLARKLIGRL